MTSNIQQLREMIPLYLNGSLSEQQASEFIQSIKNHPELEQELADFSAINDTFETINIPDDEQFNDLFNQIETKINQDPVKQTISSQHQESWLDRIKGQFLNPYVSWGVALAQFAIVAVIIFQMQSEKTDIRYQSLSHNTPQQIASINVVFTETATLTQLNKLLLEHQLDIVSGPGRGKVFLLSVEDTAQLDHIIQQLRQSDIVRFAEKTGAE